jgi:hypothetical protein
MLEGSKLLLQCWHADPLGARRCGCDELRGSVAIAPVFARPQRHSRRSGP